MNPANYLTTHTIRWNCVASSKITGALGKTGGIAGYLTTGLYNDFYPSNLIVSNMESRYLIGNHPDEKFINTLNYKCTNNITEHGLNLNIDNLDKIDIENAKDVQKINIGAKIEYTDDQIKLYDDSLYSSKLQWSDFKFLDEMHYPYTTKKLVNLGNYIEEKVPEIYKTIYDNKKYKGTTNYGIIPLPEEKATTEVTTMNKSLKNNKLNTNMYEIYPTGINKINIEFNKINNLTYFRYETNNVISNNIPIEKRVYSFEYNFNTPIKIIVGNEKGEEEFVYTPRDISKKITLLDGKYYYLEDTTLKENLDIIDGKYVNLYKDKALGEDGYIYDLQTKAKGSEKVEDIKILEESIPIAEYTYLGNIIETYYNMCKIISEAEEVITEYQTYIKDGKIFVLDGGLNIYGDSVIIDAYNNKEYQTALGKDGKIYDFKEKIKYPEEFKNENITQMSNNINNDRHEILIMYEDGRVYAFNYITGNVLFDTNAETEKEDTVLDKIVSSVKTMLRKSKPVLYEPEAEEYEEAKELKGKLEDTPLEEAEKKLEEKEARKNTLGNTITTQNASESTVNNTIKESQNSVLNTNVDSNENENTKPSNTNNTNTLANNNTEIKEVTSEKNSYVTVYDSNTNKYLVYKTTSILGIDQNKEVVEPVSETEKIEANTELKEYYETANGRAQPGRLKGVYLIIVSITAIGLILIFMYKKKNYT